ncbi:MAG: efflux RND transporter periplasmic adaptor subunit [Verrucomicrobia bacterium]|nr:efflux RND transporter periplasmic adaptor subunit [Verrucomicrobiota bacterium]
MNPESSHSATEHDIPPDLKKPGAGSIILVLVVFLIFIAAMFFLGSEPRRKQGNEIKADAQERANAIPKLSVAKPRETPGDSEVTLNCDIKANKSTTIIARTNGYLKKLHAEINDIVKEGQLLAEIDAPEIDAELVRSRAALDQAKASLAKSKTDLELAERLLKRERNLPSAARTAEELDIKTAQRDNAANGVTRAEADVEYAEAEVQRLTTLQGFEKVVAPYAGRITFRFLDVGALVSQGNNANAELFTISEIDNARIIIHAPQSYATDINLKSIPVLTVRNYPGREYQGIIAGNAGQFDPATRTMLFLLIFPNPDGSLYPGMYGQVKLALTSHHQVLQIPTSAIMATSEGTRVMLVKDGVVHLKPISTGRDFGNNIEVLTGLTTDDQVAVNPQVQITEGTKVQAVLQKEVKSEITPKPAAK